MDNYELIAEEQRQLLLDIKKLLSNNKKLIKQQLEQYEAPKESLIVSGQVKVNTQKEVEVSNLKELKDSFELMGKEVEKAIKQNKPVSEMIVSNIADAVAKTVSVDNLDKVTDKLDEIKESVSMRDQPVVNVTKQDIKLPTNPKEAIAVRLSDGKTFYSAVTSLAGSMQSLPIVASTQTGGLALATVGVDSPKGMFNDLSISERTPIIELKANYGISALRDITAVAGSGAVTNDNTEYLLSTGVTTSSSATIDSAERGRYLPGSQAQAGIGIRTASTFTGTAESKWGYFDNTNGFGFGVDATGIFTFIRRDTVDAKTYQSSWNGDKLNGSGASGITLDLSEGNIFHIDYTWYGYGVVEYSLVLADNNNKQQTVVVHKFSPAQQTSVLNPNLPIRATVTNGGTTDDIDVYIGGRQYSVFSPFNPNTRVNSHRNISKGSIGTTLLPVVSFRRKSAFTSVAAKIEGFDILTDANLIYELRLNATLTDASYGTPTSTTAAETAMEVDTSATAVSGGQLLFSGLVGSSGTGSNQTGSALVDSLLIDIPNSQSVTLCVARVSGTNATVSSVVRWKEEW